MAAGDRSVRARRNAGRAPAYTAPTAPHCVLFLNLREEWRRRRVCDRDRTVAQDALPAGPSAPREGCLPSPLTPVSWAHAWSRGLPCSVLACPPQQVQVALCPRQTANSALCGHVPPTPRVTFPTRGKQQAWPRQRRNQKPEDAVQSSRIGPIGLGAASPASPSCTRDRSQRGGCPALPAAGLPEQRPHGH